VSYGPPDGWAPPARVELDKSLFDWFNYWGFEHGYETEMVSIREGGLIPRNTKPIEELQASASAIVCHPQSCESRQATIDPVTDDNELASIDSSRSRTTTSAPTRVEDNVPIALRQLIDVQSTEQGQEAQHCKLIAGWAKNPLCVVDPFIQVKNVTGNISKAILKKFEMDCQRAAVILRMGGSLDDVLSSKEKAERPGTSKPHQETTLDPLLLVKQNASEN